MYFKDGREYIDNSWEYFFEQPCGYTLDDIQDNENPKVLKGRFHPAGYEYLFTPDYFPISPLDDEFELSDRKDEIRKYLKFNKEMITYFEETYKKVIGDKKEILGILCRGTDYAKKGLMYEQKQPATKQVIKKAKEYIKKYPDIKYIYLTTESSAIYEEFKNEFGDMMLPNPQYMYGDNYVKNKLLGDIPVERKNHNYTLAKEYMANIYIVSKCKYFIGGRTTGSLYAWIMTDSWKDFYVFKFGTFRENRLRHKIFSRRKYSCNNKEWYLYIVLGIKIKRIVHR